MNLYRENIYLFDTNYPHFNYIINNEDSDIFITYTDSEEDPIKVFSKKLNNKIAPQDIPNVAKLYFSKRSDFPRFKLSGTDFKRKLKLETADYVVTSNNHGFKCLSHHCSVFKCEEGIYIIPNTPHILCAVNKPGRYYDPNWAKQIRPYVSKEGITGIFKALNITTTNLKLIEEDVSVVRTNYDDFIWNLMSGTLKQPIILDSDLDMKINSTFDTLDEDSVDSLYDMLTSSDVSNRSVGLKLLCSYNVGMTPMTVRTLLSLRGGNYGLSEFNSVGVNQVKDTVKYNTECYVCNKSYTEIARERGLLGSSAPILYHKDIPTDEVDIKLTKRIIKKELEKWYNENFTPEKALGKLANLLNFKIKYSIE